MGLADPPLRTWQLNSNSSRYDYDVAAPSDEVLHIIWSAWSAAYLTMSTFNAIVLFGVLSSRNVRRKPFNLYLIYLMVPDVIFTFFCGIQCAFLASANGYQSSWECYFQSAYLVFGIAANAWLNGVIAVELHRLLRLSKRRQRYFPPSSRTITFRALCVYLWALVLALMGVVEISFIPYDTIVQHGLVCLPGEYSKASTIFFWCFFFPLLVAIPLCYAIYVVYDIWRNQLLPEKGKARDLSIYFFRLVVVFVLMWLPAIMVLYVLGQINDMVFYTIAGWAHAQGAVSAACSMMKPDVKDAVMKFIKCKGWWLESPDSKGSVVMTDSHGRPVLLNSFGWRASSLEYQDQNPQEEALTSVEQGSSRERTPEDDVGSDDSLQRDIRVEEQEGPRQVKEDAHSGDIAIHENQSDLKEDYNYEP